VFKGDEKPAKEWECVLIYDEATQTFTLEKLDSLVNLNFDAKAPPRTRQAASRTSLSVLLTPACIPASLARPLPLRCVACTLYAHTCTPHTRPYGSRMPTLTPHARSCQPLLFFRRPNTAALPITHGRRRARSSTRRLQHWPRHRHRCEWKAGPGKLLLAGTRRRGGRGRCD
jgi:hypothetical protein